MDLLEVKQILECLPDLGLWHSCEIRGSVYSLGSAVLKEPVVELDVWKAARAMLAD